MLSNLLALKMVSLLALKMVSIPLMYLSSKWCSTGLSKHQELGMNVLRDILIANFFKVGKDSPPLFTKTIDNDLFVCQIYVVEIIFWSTNKSSCEEFSRIMIQKFEMSMMGELK
jgi:hypothetical protein